MGRVFPLDHPWFLVLCNCPDHGPSAKKGVGCDAVLCSVSLTPEDGLESPLWWGSSSEFLCLSPVPSLFALVEPGSGSWQSWVDNHLWMVEVTVTCWVGHSGPGGGVSLETCLSDPGFSSWGWRNGGRLGVWCSQPVPFQRENVCCVLCQGMHLSPFLRHCESQ